MPRYVRFVQRANLLDETLIVSRHRRLVDGTIRRGFARTARRKETEENQKTTTDQNGPKDAQQNGTRVLGYISGLLRTQRIVSEHWCNIISVKITVKVSLDAFNGYILYSVRMSHRAHCDISWENGGIQNLFFIRLKRTKNISYFDWM